MKYIVTICCLLTSSSLFAQNSINPKLHINIIPQTVRQRTYAPVPVILRSTWQGTAPLTGNLRIEARSGNHKLYMYKTPSISFPPGVQDRYMMLPPLDENSLANVDLKITLLSKNSRYEIPLQRLTFIESNIRSFSIGIASTSFIRRRKINPGDALRLEKLLKEQKKTSFFGRTGITFIKANEMPNSATAYCAYDILLLQGEAFTELNKKQLFAIKQWVLAGGALCLIMENASFGPEHLDFINNILKENRSPVKPFFLNKKRQIVSSDLDKQENISAYRPGLGRLVIIKNKIASAEFFDTIPWRHASAFLWRIRTDIMNNVIREGIWEKSDKKLQDANKRASQYATAYEKGFDSTFSYGYNRHESLTRLINSRNQWLLPKTFRTIPAWLLMLILISLVLLVGPIDYIILGKLKSRRLTWYVFPVVCLFYAAVTVFFAKYYMGVNDHFGHISIIDEGKEGKILRKTEYEMVFTGSSKVVTKSYQQCFFSQQSSWDKTYDIEGNLFSDYIVKFESQQWRPQLNRINYLCAGKTQHPGWQFPEKLGPGSLEKFQTLDFIEKGKDVGVFVIQKQKKRALLQPLHSDFDVYIKDLTFFMDAANASSSVFQVFSGRSPSPEYGKNELLMIDGTDEGEVLVLVVYHDPETREITIYRRLYLNI